MLQNFSKLKVLKMAFFLPVWVFVGIFTAQYLLVGLALLLDFAGVSLEYYNQVVVNTTLTALLYVLSLIIIVGLPYKLIKDITTKNDLGLSRLPNWTDIIVAPAGLIIYFVLSSVLILIATQILPWFDVNEVQNTGFNQINQHFELILAFMSLVIIAPIAEEIIFRGYLYGRLKKYMPVWVAIFMTSITFGFIHGAWNLAIDTFALSILLCLLRESTGSIWASILLHMAKNGIAFYILFINL